MTNPTPLFDDGSGPGLDPVAGEFKPSFETVHPGGGAHPIRLCQLSRFSRFCQLKDIVGLTTKRSSYSTPPGSTFRVSNFSCYCRGLILRTNRFVVMPQTLSPPVPRRSEKPDWSACCSRLLSLRHQSRGVTWLQSVIAEWRDLQILDQFVEPRDAVSRVAVREPVNQRNTS